MGTMLAVTQSVGSTPVAKDLLNSVHKGEEMCSAVVFRRKGVIQSGPHMLCWYSGYIVPAFTTTNMIAMYIRS